MSDPGTPIRPEDEDDLLAAEYVLGTLDAAAWRAAHERAGVEGGFAARVRAWEGRLAALNAGYAEVPVAPDAWARLQARLFPAPAAQRRWGLGWLAGVALAGVVAGGVIAVLNPGLFGGLIPVPGVPQAAPLTARLAAEDGALVFAASYDPAAGRLTLRREAGDGPGTGQDHELWAIDDTGTPRSLGLVSGAETVLDTALAAGIVLAVSLEPTGGSPQPVPTGPVLAAAPLSGV